MATASCVKAGACFGARRGSAACRRAMPAIASATTGSAVGTDRPAARWKAAMAAAATLTVEIRRVAPISVR